MGSMLNGTWTRIPLQRSATYTPNLTDKQLAEAEDARPTFWKSGDTFVFLF